LNTRHFFQKHYSAFPNDIGHCGPVDSVLFTPDDQNIISSSYDGQIIVWDWQNGKVIRRIRQDECDNDSHLQISHDGSLIAVRGMGCTKIMSVATDRCIRRIKDYWCCGGFTPDGYCILSYESEPDLTVVWDIRKNQAVYTFEGNEAALAEDKILIIGKTNLELYCLVTGKLLTSVSLPKEKDYDSYVPAISPDGRWVALYQQIPKHKLIDMTTGKVVYTQIGPDDSFPPVFSPDCKHIVFCTDKGKVRLLECGTWKQLYDVTVSECWVRQAAFSNDGSLLAIASDDGRVIVLEAESGNTVQVLNSVSLNIYSVSIGEDDLSVEITYIDGLLYHWNMESGPVKLGSRKVVSRFLYVYDCNAPVTCSEDGKLVALAMQPCGDSQQVRIYKYHSPEIVSETSIEPWQGQYGDTVYSATFSHDSELLAVGYDNGNVGIWSIESNRWLRIFKVRVDAPGVIAYSPDNDQAAVGTGYDGDIEIFSISSGKRVKHFAAHAGSTSAISFFSDGQHLVSGGADGTVRVWDLDSNKPMISLTRIPRDSGDEWVVTREIAH